MKKFFLITFSILLLLFILVLAAPFLFKKQILALVKDQANKNVNAIVYFDDDIELSLIKNFPHFTLGLNNLTVSGIDDFEGDTLIHLTSFDATLDVMSVIKGEQIKILNILLDEPTIHAIVLKNGKANWDIAKASTDTTTTAPDTAATAFNIALKKFEIRKANITYDDQAGNMKAVLKNFNHTLTGDFSQDNMLMTILMSCDQLTYAMGGVHYLNKVKLDVKADIDANLKDMKFTFKENSIALNELAFGFDGFVAMPADPINLDVKFEAKKAEFKHFLSLVPGVYTKDFSNIQTSGKLAFNGFAKGTYSATSLPAFAFNLLVENARFQYPDLPAPVENIQIQFNATNPDGNLNNTVANLSKFHFETAGDQFDAKLLASNVMKDPAIDASLKGRLNLGNISKIVPLEEGMSIAGMLVADLTAKGNLSTIEKQQYENFNAQGTLALSGFKFASKDLPKPYVIEQAGLTFNPKTVSLTAFDASIGNSDMQMTGELSNFFAYTFGKGTLKGILNFKSNQLDANAFLASEDAPAQADQSTDTASIVAPEIPNNIDFTLNASIGKILYTNMEIERFMGQVKIADAKLAFNNIQLSTIGSSIKMSGFYETADPKKPTTDMSLSIQNMEFKKAFKTFNTIQKIAPIAEKMTGAFSTDFTMKTQLDNHLNPVYESLFAQGNLFIPNAGLSDVKVFNKAAELLKYDQLKDPAINNVNVKFMIAEGKVTTEPFDLMVAGQKLTLAGYTSLDQKINYTGMMVLPKSALGPANTVVNDLLAKANAKAGTNITTSDVLPINLLIGGTFTDPKITTNLADVAKNEGKNLTDQLKAEADRKRKELEAKAKAEMNKAKAEAEAKARAEVEKARAKAQAEADKAKAKAQAEADRLKAEAEAKAKAEQERLKKQAEEEAKKKLKGLFGK